MDIALISPYPNITAFGLRTISAYLKSYGHSTRFIILPTETTSGKLKQPSSLYRKRILDELSALCESTELVGISVMTNFFDEAVEITTHFKNNGIPVIWGGIHPTIKPQECLQYADMVCIGDGEEAMLELVTKMTSKKDISNIKNLFLSNQLNHFFGSHYTLASDLDKFPPPDFGMQNHFILTDGNIKPFSKEIMERSLLRFEPLGVPGYQTMTGRGCPHNCSYCANDMLRKMCRGQKYLRWRSASHVISELRWVTDNMPYVGFIWIADDAFFARKVDDLIAFCDLYKKEIGLPFSCLASPLTVTDQKMDILVDAGMVYLQMGVESGSQRMQKLYNRKMMSNLRILQAMKVINRYRDKIFPPEYDFLIDNPYESLDDKRATIKLVADIPKPYRLNLFSLVFYPGTEIAVRAMRDGHVVDEKKDVYSRKGWGLRNYNFYNFLLTWASSGMAPSILLNFLTHPFLSFVMNSKFLRPCFRPLTKVLRLFTRFAIRKSVSNHPIIKSKTT